MNKRFFLSFSVLLLLASCRQKSGGLFTPLSSSQTGVSFANHLEQKDRFNILYYLYYYNGGGVATGDINNDGLPDLYFSANRKGGNKLYLNKGDFTFEDITETAGVAGTADWCSGVTMADVNGDSLLDIYVSAVSGVYDLKGHNLLYINKGNNQFEESATAYGVNFSGMSTQAAFFDYDRDGDLDFFLLNHSQQPHANIVDTANRRKQSPLSGDRLYRNELNTGAAKFVDVSGETGIYQSNLGYGLGLAVGDFNNDGWDDVYVGNDFHENDYYYLNNQKGGFVESGAAHFGHYSRFSMGNDAADFNNDGQLDMVTVDMLPHEEKVLKTYGSDENADIYKMKLAANGYQYQYSRNMLQRNNGSGSSFSEVGLLSGISATDWSWSPLFADFDNDGSKDLFISSGIVKRPMDLDYIRYISSPQVSQGLARSDQYDREALDKMPNGAAHPFFFKGDGDLRFTEVSEAWGTAGLEGYYNGAAYADLDNDGAVDVVINSLNAEAIILKNNSPKKNYLSIDLKGEGGNRNGIGSKVYLFQKGRLQYQQVMATRGFQSASDTRLHFGLGDANTVDSLLVVWPDQRFQVIKNVPAGKPLILQQGAASGQFVYPSFFGHEKQVLHQAPVGLSSWLHRENDFVDYNIQYLIPHAQSTRGPKLAVGDVNGDGLDDLYACGAKGQEGTLLIQSGNGSFAVGGVTAFIADAASEDVDAVFFDANGDKALDLYVVSGGNEETGQRPTLLDRLYLNDGKGYFTKSPLPPVYANKSCVAAADVDGDGDTDLFVGTLADARAYGVAQTSYLLLNDGAGMFTVAGADKMPLNDLGMVTSALFTDINKDNQSDLVVAGEFMPVTIFLNKQGSFVKSAVPASTGWWQTMLTDDVNGDGHMDILAGNWGWNNKFWSGKNGPVKLYVSDFDKNGSIDHLLSYTIGGKEYPFLAKDEVERSLPVLKKHYLKYEEFAGLEMKDAYYGFAETVQPLQAERLGSAVFYGDGKGGFTIQDLPAPLQQAPIFSFQKIEAGGKNYFLAGGNFFDVIPYEGRYDAQPLALFEATKEGIRYIHQSNLSGIMGQVRDVKMVRGKNNAGSIVVARNNSSLLFFNPKP
ncbi:VCBS repeat-containing protein [Flavisolibacter sp. BT320]|nr:VCBS repeat-containing protein [Flavisolibacter longurius]